MDWWHIITTAALALALGAEALGAYCGQKDRLREILIETTPPPSVHEKRWWWSRLWWKRDEEGRPIFRELIFQPEAGPTYRGIGRLLIAAVLLVRFAAGAAMPWMG